MYKNCTVHNINTQKLPCSTLYAFQISHFATHTHSLDLFTQQFIPMHIVHCTIINSNSSWSLFAFKAFFCLRKGDAFWLETVKKRKRFCSDRFNVCLIKKVVALFWTVICVFSVSGLRLSRFGFPKSWKLHYSHIMHQKYVNTMQFPRLKLNRVYDQNWKVYIAHCIGFKYWLCPPWFYFKGGILYHASLKLVHFLSSQPTKKY